MTGKANAKNRVLITGGAGFIGCNAAQRFLSAGWQVTVWDNLSRRGGKQNLEWLRQFGEFDFSRVDLRNEKQVANGFGQHHFDMVLHAAGQVAVTSSVTNPREDLECNVLGTFNLLEAVRLQDPEAFFVFASTNKVYGSLEDVRVIERNRRYEYEDLPLGISEAHPLDFHSPYGCSKGAADQYVRDYARIYGLATVSFRQSCIYGYRQFGVEDQGWVAWFAIAHALGRAITLYGDGKQTRDVLFIDDLTNAYLLAYEKRAVVSGKIYNLGGGPGNQLSLLELIGMLKNIRKRPVEFTFARWRPGDQKVFVADIRKAKTDFGWEPTYSCATGVEKLVHWVDANRDLFTLV